MALLKGFPPSNTISPSVRIAERDLSFYGNVLQSGTIGAFIGFASKGPVNLPVLINSQVELNKIFGYPHPDTGDPYLLYAASQYLRSSQACYILRVAETSTVNNYAATTATVDLIAAGERVTIHSNQIGPDNTYTISKDTFFRWKLNGTLASKILVVPAGIYTTAELVTLLNDQLIPDIDGIEFFIYNETSLNITNATSVNNTIGLRSVWAYGNNSSIEFVSVLNSLYGENSEVGLGTGMMPAESMGTYSKYPTSDSYQGNGNYDFTGLTGQSLEIVVDGTDNSNIDGVIQVVSLAFLEGSSQTLDNIVTAINIEISNLPGGFYAKAVGDRLAFETLHSGRDAKLLVKTNPTASVVFGFTGTTAMGVSPAGSSSDINIDTLGIVSGTSFSNASFGLNSANINNLVIPGVPEISMTITADSPGIDGNDTTILIENDPETGNFNLLVFNKGFQVEAWGQLSKNPGSRYYVETYLNLVSDYIRAIDNTLVAAPPANNGPNGSTLKGGTDGIPPDPDDQDSILIGNRVSYTGLWALSEPDQITIDVVAVPGHSSTRVVKALIDMCTERGDAFAIIDPPFGLTVREIIQWANGVHPLNSFPLNTDFAALYWPWLMINDTDNGINVWVPPSGSVCGAYSQNDTIAGPWFAPAGLSRGVLTNVLDVYSRPSLAERDLMYGNGNAINPIVTFADTDGFVIFGQKTLQRRPTALDRVNVRRMMFYIERQIKNSAKSLLFEPNDASTRSQFISLAKNTLDTVKIKRGLTDYVVQCDENLNTADVIDRNELRAKIGVIPTKAVEFIFIEFTIQRTGTI